MRLSPLAFVLCSAVWGAAGPDFSGIWVLDAGQSEVRTPAARKMKIEHNGTSVQCQDIETGVQTVAWQFTMQGPETRTRIGASEWRTVTKWEGAALLINTIVNGPQSYTRMDRWKLSRDGLTLTIRREIVRADGSQESTLVYQREDLTVRASAAPQPAAAPTAPPEEFVVPAGTRIPLSLLNSLSTKYSREGDRVYLNTVFPIMADGRIVIPPGSYVAGTVTLPKRPGRVKGRGELYLRFESLTLPNGVTRDFRSRLGSTDGQSDVDRKEGKITGEGDKAGDAQKIGAGAGMGATIGGLAGRSAKGVGIGALAGAAAGLAGVLLTRGPDVVLSKGTTLEMVLDRDLRYKRSELGR